MMSRCDADYAGTNDGLFIEQLDEPPCDISVADQQQLERQSVIRNQ
jgi:hypothetical protein